MSDTLPEGESGTTTACECGRLGHSEQVRGLPRGAKVKAITDIAQLGENVRIGTKGTVTGHCSDGRAIIFFDGFPHSHTFHTPNGYIDLLTDETATDYCDECKGRPHAPWCSAYKEPDTRRSGEMGHRTNHEQAASSHETTKKSPCPACDTTGKCDMCGGTGDLLVEAETVVLTQSQHQSLVAERERLRDVLRKTLKAIEVIDFSNCREGAYDSIPWSEIEEAVNEQRSTSE